MEIITLSAAEEAGFDPRSYSNEVKWGKLNVKLDFLGEAGPTGKALFFSLESNGERFYYPIHLAESDAEKAASAFTYLQTGDICKIHAMHADGMPCVIRSIDLITQKPLCKWREQCDQLSPCCVFKS